MAKLKLTRNQLASFLPDHETVKQFETLFSVVDEINTTGYNDAVLAAGLADTKAQQALDSIERVANENSLAALSPAIENNNSVFTDYIDFAQTGPHTNTPGRLAWNQTDGTLDLNLRGGNVTLQIGQEQVVRVVNKSGGALVDGQVVYVSGAQGQRPKVELAVATGASSLARKVIGLVTEPIANNQEGYITISGMVRGLNTSAFTDGDVLYLSATPGAITNVPPAAPIHHVVVGFCINANPAVGEIFVTVQPGYDLEDLSDVVVTAPASGNLLIYDAVAQVWENALITAGTGATVTNGPGTITISATGTGGTVTSVAQSFTGGLISVAGSPITTAGTLALTVAGTSGGIPYFTSASTWASSALLAANALVVGGGAGLAPATVTTGANVVTALGVAVGTAGSFVVNGGALGIPSSGTVTNLTGTASININGTVGATTANTGAFTSLSYTTTLTGGTGIVNLGSGQFYKDATGKVGIGTAVPITNLHVSTGDQSTNRLRLQNTGTGGGTFDIVGGQPGVSNAGLAIFDVTSSATRLYIDSSGNIQLGAATGTSQTQVKGTGQETAALTDAGNKGGSIYLQATAVAAGSGGACLFGSTFGSQTPFAAIKGFVEDGSTNTTGSLRFSTRNATADTALTERAKFTVAGDFLLTSSGGLGYGTGSGGAVTQITSRATGVTLNKTNGAITMFSAAGSAVAATFTVTNSTVAATDTVILSVKSSTNVYLMFVTAVAAGNFNVTFQTTGGVSTDAPVINFAVIKAVTA